MTLRTSILLCLSVFLAPELLLASELPAGQKTLDALADRVADELCEKQLVVLAELPSHGEAQAFQTKARIAERLIDRCGFRALFFEAGVYDFLGFQERIPREEATLEQLDNAIGGFWKTRGLAEWRRKLFDLAVSGRLILGGLDDQPSASSVHARATLPSLVAKAVPEPQAEPCREAVERNLFWRYDEQNPFGEEQQQQLERCARQAAEALAESESVVPRRMLENIAGYYARQLEPSTAPDRDEVMARNLGWQLDRLPADSKTIVWTATVHAARQQGGLKYRPLGARLADTWQDRMAVVGFTAFAGESSRAGGPARPIPEAPAESLEAKAASTDAPAIYLDRSALRALGTVSSRLFGRWTEADWSVAFDGVVVIREETAPVVDR